MQQEAVPQPLPGHQWILVRENDDRLAHLIRIEGDVTLCGQHFEAYDVFAEALPTDSELAAVRVCDACLRHLP